MNKVQEVLNEIEEANSFEARVDRAIGYNKMRWGMWDEELKGELKRDGNN